MEENENKQKAPFNCFSAIIITQCICVTVIIFTILGLKLCFKEEFSAVKDWYTKNICVDTDINEVLSEEEESNAF